MEDNVRKRMYVCVCVCERERERLDHFALQQKLTEHYKSTIIEKIILKNFSMKDLGLNK